MNNQINRYLIKYNHSLFLNFQIQLPIFKKIKTQKQFVIPMNSLMIRKTNVVNTVMEIAIIAMVRIWNY